MNLERISLLGRDVAFRRFGKGPPLVLIHGYGGSPGDWEPTSAHLSQKFELFIPNFNHLYLDPKHKNTFVDLIETLAVFCDHVFKLTGESPVLGGASFGAAIAWGLAILHPHLVSRLVLLSPMPPNPLKRLRDPIFQSALLISRLPYATTAALLTPAARRVLPRVEKIFQIRWARRKNQKRPNLSLMNIRKARVIAHALERFSWLIRHEDWGFWESRLRSVELPVLLVWGKEDLLFLEVEKQRLNKVFKKSMSVTIQKAGHLLSRECPVEVSDAITAFALASDFEKAASLPR